MTCTFFGHRDAPMDLAKALKDKLKFLIEEIADDYAKNKR